MPAKESIQHVLDRVRPPRVQITYDVEIGDAVEQKELPLVVGVLADLAGQQKELPRLKERKFVEIDRDNFDQVMAAIGPLLRLSVPDKLRDDDSRMAVELRFKSIDSFHPRQLVEQIEPLRKLLESRQRLVDLIAKLDGNDALADVLRSALADRARLQALQSELATKREP
ncbi:type VI secretion system contractile sheath small subunit [Cystobacter ferrugineus]|uniref:Type VI secretion system-associated protein n=1 Tax=Cystobacter ferrugineus TaxID=83449 RepID=A0A1L9BI91_9BACT|nr:type VI secretion system contractile sheath small subunit [Cystobacter ferrugineus]OJH42024.1 type VI secretion system-associated protein [Cystobacter ferrugineus]